jgi:hypothetical protein
VTYWNASRFFCSPLNCTWCIPKVTHSLARSYFRQITHHKFRHVSSQAEEGTSNVFHMKTWRLNLLCAQHFVHIVFVLRRTCVLRLIINQTALYHSQSITHINHYYSCWTTCNTTNWYAMSGRFRWHPVWAIKQSKRPVLESVPRLVGSSFAATIQNSPQNSLHTFPVKSQRTDRQTT